MPSYHEIRLYLGGLWLLIRGDAQGFRQLDISDRGMMRSFWAFIWSLPGMFIYWNWTRLLFLHGEPPETRTGLPFFARLAMIDLFNWILPLVIVGIVCVFLGMGKKFPAIVATANWLSVPFAYAQGILVLGLMALPSAAAMFGLLQLAMLLAGVFATSRIIRMICGPQPLTVAGLVIALLLPSLLITETLQRFLGVYPL